MQIRPLSRRRAAGARAPGQTRGGFGPGTGHARGRWAPPGLRGPETPAHPRGGNWAKGRTGGLGPIGPRRGLTESANVRRLRKGGAGPCRRTAGGGREYPPLQVVGGPRGKLAGIETWEDLLSRAAGERVVQGARGGIPVEPVQFLHEGPGFGCGGPSLFTGRRGKHRVHGGIRRGELGAILRTARRRNPANAVSTIGGRRLLGGSTFGGHRGRRLGRRRRMGGNGRAAHRLTKHGLRHSGIISRGAGRPKRRRIESPRRRRLSPLRLSVEKGRLLDI